MAPHEEMSKTSQNPDTISTLREQIKSNTKFLFANAASDSFDIALLTTNQATPSSDESDEDHSGGEQPRYQAAATYNIEISSHFRATCIAAMSSPQDSVRAALESLMLVLATALEKQQGRVFQKHPGSVEAMAGGSFFEAKLL